MNKNKFVDQLDALEDLPIVDAYGREVVGFRAGTLRLPTGNERAICIESRTEVAEAEFEATERWRVDATYNSVGGVDLDEAIVEAAGRKSDGSGYFVADEMIPRDMMWDRLSEPEARAMAFRIGAIQGVSAVAKLPPEMPEDDTVFVAPQGEVVVAERNMPAVALAMSLPVIVMLIAFAVALIWRWFRQT